MQLLMFGNRRRDLLLQVNKVSTLLHMMAKRRQGDRSGKASKCRDEESLTDRISKLPDDLLLSILSRLSFKEATMTSLLSQRWRYLWTFLPKLDFDGANLLMKVMSGKRRGLQLDTERAYFIRCVGHGMESSDYPIEQFRVFFNLNKECTSSIDKWLRHALARKVQRLELDFTDYDSRKKHKHEDFYTFPYTFLSANAGYFYRSSRYWSRRQCESVDFSSLRKIVMNCVNVSGKALEFFLHHCPLLEDLSVSESIDVSTLKITRPVRSFKRLEISFCHSLRKVEIRDANIVYLKFEGYAKIPFLLEGVPLLVEIYVGGDSTNILSNPFDMFEKCLPQIEIFTIQRVGHFYWIDTEFCETVNLSNLKQLVIKQEIFSLSDYSLLPLSSIIEVAPRLQRFVLEVMRWYPEFSDRRIHKFEGSYPHLKEVEIVGYCSVMSEVELLEHFMESAVALEKITLDPRKPCKAPYEIKPSIDRYVSSWMFDPKFKNEFARQEMDARTHAMKLNVPPGVNLQIL